MHCVRGLGEQCRRQHAGDGLPMALLPERTCRRAGRQSGVRCRRVLGRGPASEGGGVSRYGSGRYWRGVWMVQIGDYFGSAKGKTLMRDRHGMIVTCVRLCSPNSLGLVSAVNLVTSV